VLGTPPALILSQDQTLKLKMTLTRRRPPSHPFGCFGEAMAGKQSLTRVAC
jgi:hypothetical protein